MGRIEWGMWANFQALGTATVVFAGAIIVLAGSFGNANYAYYGFAISVFTTMLEYPRGKRKKENTPERPYQKYLVPLVKLLGPFGRNYYVRFVIYLGASIGCFFVVPMVIGGILFIVTSLTYFRAALAGEYWATEKQKYTKSKLKISEAPTRPPPRADISEDEPAGSSRTNERLIPRHETSSDPPSIPMEAYPSTHYGADAYPVEAGAGLQYYIGPDGQTYAYDPSQAYDPTASYDPNQDMYAADANVQYYMGSDGQTYAYDPTSAVPLEQADPNAAYYFDEATQSYVMVPGALAGSTDPNFGYTDEPVAYSGPTRPKTRPNKRPKPLPGGPTTDSSDI